MSTCAVCIVTCVAALVLWTLPAWVCRLSIKPLCLLTESWGNGLFGISMLSLHSEYKMYSLHKEPNDNYAKHITIMQHATCLLRTSTCCLMRHSVNVNTNTRQSFTGCNVVLMLRCWSTHQLLHRGHEERGRNGSH